MIGQAFSSLGNSASIAASTSSANVALPGSPGAGQTVRVYNAAIATAHVRWGAGAQTATLGNTMVGPGATEVFSIPHNVDNVAAILSSGTGTVLVQRGAGV